MNKFGPKTHRLADTLTTEFQLHKQTYIGRYELISAYVGLLA